MPLLEHKTLNAEFWKKRLSYLRSKFGIQYSKQGYTLIEIMIALSIIGVLATIGIVSFTKTQETARDSRRKQDLRSIAVALELYRQKNGHYPCTDSSDNGGIQMSKTDPGGFWLKNVSAVSGCGGTDPRPFNSNYIIQLPADPKNNTATNHQATSEFGYGYFSRDDYGCLAGKSYILFAYLENTSDKDTAKNANVKYCDGRNLGDVWSTRMFAITAGY